MTNWAQYQHYRDRTPIWIKLYVEMLHDEKLKKLPIHSRLLFDQMLLLAGMFQNSVPSSPELLEELTGIPRELCGEAVADLLKTRLLREKNTRRSASKQTQAYKEKREEEKRERAKAKKLKTLATNLSTSLTLEQLVDELKAAGADEVTARRLASEAKEAA